MGIPSAVAHSPGEGRILWGMDQATLDYYSRRAPELAAVYELAHGGVADRFEATFPTPMRILDVGAGAGRHMARLRQLGHDAWGVEPILEFRSAAWTLHEDVALHMVPGGLPADLPPVAELGGPFDAILCNGVMMHLPESALVAAATTLRSCLKPGGRLMFTVPLDRPGLDGECRDKAGRLFTTLSPEKWTSYLTDSGFTVLDRWEDKDLLGRPGHHWLGLLLQAGKD